MLGIERKPRDVTPTLDQYLRTRQQGSAELIPRVTMRDALADPALLGGVLTGPTWRPWRVLLIAAMGKVLDLDERAVFEQLTQRAKEPGQRVEEFVGVIGRRGGKSRAIAITVTYIAGLNEQPESGPWRTRGLSGDCA